MKPQKSGTFLYHVTAYAALVTFCAAPSALAATRWWDAGNTNIAANGNGAAITSASSGNGTWSTGISNWDQGNGLAHVSWVDSQNDTAFFNGGTSTINLGSNVTLGGITQQGGGGGININGTASNFKITLGITGNNTFAIFTGTTSRAATINAEIAGVSGNNLNFTGGNLTLNGVNTFAGNIAISTSTAPTGNLTIGSAGSLGSGSYAGNVSIATGRVFNYNSSANQTLSGAISGGGSLAKGTSSVSTLTLSNNNTGFAGATTVSAGTLAISSSGAINSSSGITLSGGTFRYNSTTNLTPAVTFTSGTIAGTNWNGTLAGQTIGTGQTISPGNSPGTATTVGQTWANGGSYVWEINNATGTAGTDPGWDLVNGTGTLDITAASGSQFNILVNSLTLANVGGLATNFNDALNYNWLLADFNTVTGFAANAFNINTSAFTNPFTGTFGVSLGGAGAVPGDSSQIYLTYAAIPEPDAAILGCLGLLAMLRRRR